jgi:Na+-translocating ferredoxin:NAD+ oxidoreductase RnfG subunit
MLSLIRRSPANPFSKARPSARRIRGALFVIAAVVGSAMPAYAATYWTPRAILSSFFSKSKLVTHKKVTLDDESAKQIAKRLGLPTLKTEWEVYWGERDGERDGFAVLDSEKGMHEPIDFAVRFTMNGAVDRVEILEYREAYGDEIRGDRFRAQFKGKTANDPIAVGKDIDIVSGASISSRSIAIGVKRDALILQTALKSGSL